MSLEFRAFYRYDGLSKDVRLSLDQYRDGHVYRRYLMGVLTETDNLIAMCFINLEPSKHV